MVSCATTKYVDREVPVETVRTEYITKLQKDSVYIHDSIDRYIRGDTVYQMRYKYIYKYLTRTDTLVQQDTIEIPVKVTEVREVTKIKWYQSLLIWLGGITIALLAFKIGRFVKKII